MESEERKKKCLDSSLSSIGGYDTAHTTVSGAHDASCHYCVNCKVRYTTRTRAQAHPTAGCDVVTGESTALGGLRALFRYAVDGVVPLFHPGELRR